MDNEKLQDLQQQAESGDVEAMYYLGEAYSYGPYQDMGKMFYWFQRACETKEGVHLAANALAWCYYAGEGTDQDEDLARFWWEKAADEGDLSAMSQLATLSRLEAEEMGGSFLEQAFECCKRSAENGHPIDQWVLGDHYWEGDGVERNYEEAVKWWSKSASQGYPEPMMRLTKASILGKGTPWNPFASLYWLLRLFIINLEEKRMIRTGELFERDVETLPLSPQMKKQLLKHKRKDG